MSQPDLGNAEAGVQRQFSLAVVADAALGDLAFDQLDPAIRMKHDPGLFHDSDAQHNACPKTIHAADAVAIGAQSDYTTAYNDLAGQASNST